MTTATHHSARLIERSYLPYLSDLRVSIGTDQTDTFKRTLAQNHKFTDAVVDADQEEVGTLNALMTGRASVGDQPARECRFSNMEVHRNTK